jgi:hypothetical protein
VSITVQERDDHVTGPLVTFDTLLRIRVAYLGVVTLLVLAFQPPVIVVATLFVVAVAVGALEILSALRTRV